METIIFIILGIIITGLLIKLIAWLTDIVIKLVIVAACLAVLVVLFEVPIPPAVIEQAKEGFYLLQQQINNIDLVALKDKLSALLELSREVITG